VKKSRPVQQPSGSKTSLFRAKFCEASGLSHVPIEETGEQLPYTTVAEFIERARGKYESGLHKEGIVIRPQEPVYSRITEGPLSMKVINNDFLLM
jgi:hypothetical protein